MKIMTVMCTTLLALSFNAMADNELDDGPGIFTGKKGAFTLFQTSKSSSVDTKAQTKQETTKASQITDFELFKEWKKHKETNSDSYQEFLLWIEYKSVIKS